MKQECKICLIASRLNGGYCLSLQNWLFNFSPALATASTRPIGSGRCLDCWWFVCRLRNFTANLTSSAVQTLWSCNLIRFGASRWIMSSSEICFMNSSNYLFQTFWYLFQALTRLDCRHGDMVFTYGDPIIRNSSLQIVHFHIGYYTLSAFI